MPDRAPALPLYQRVVAELATQGRSKTWLHQRTGVARNTVDNWAKQPRAPQAGTVLSVTRELGIADDEALELAGITPTGVVVTTVDLAVIGTDALLAEIRRRIPE
jgi:hypothetical protein